MKHGSCMHFNGVQNEVCKKGIPYAKFEPGHPCIQLIQKSARGGTYLRPGEVPASSEPFPGAQPTDRCEFYEEPTDEQVQAERLEQEASMQRARAAIKIASQWRVKPKPKQDRQEVVECPVCKGKLHLSQSAYNGHVHGQCETADCVSWVE